jgi:Predicted transcriptional regulators
LSKKKNAVCNVSIRQIEKNKDLTLGASKKDIDRYEKIVSAYGNVVPAIVAMNGGMYSLIDGHARIEACARIGIHEIPAVVSQTEEATEQLKLSLLLSASREQGNALSEGAIIGKLVKEHGQTLMDISRLIGRSKAWLSKRQTMVQNLSQPLKDMVLNGTICARTAEEISKLPHDEQVLFAANVVKEGLSKDDVHRLVKLYRSPDATLSLCSSIIASPAEILLSCPRTEPRKFSGKKRTTSSIHRMAYLVMNLLESFGKMLCESDDGAITAAMEHLLNLNRKMQVLSHIIKSYRNIDISLGKQEDVQND